MARQDLEQKAYGAEFASGLLETFVGVGLLCVGIGWLAGYIAIASVAPAMLAVLWPGVRSRFIAPRAGRVRFKAERRRRERTGFVGMLALGVATFGLGIAVFLTRSQGAASVAVDELIRGLPAALLAVGALLAALVFQLRRIYGHAILLLVGGVSAVVFDFDPGWSLLGTGVVLVVAGVLLLFMFFRNEPVVRAE